MGAVISFFESMLDIVRSLIIIVTKMARLILSPASALVFLVAWILGVPIYTVCLIAYFLLSLPVLDWLTWLNYYFFTTILFDLVVSILYLALFLAFALVAVCMWLADLLTFGLVRFLTRCENRLDSWYTRANFAFGNTNNRLLITQLPCAQRYKPTGFMCNRMSSEEPSYCAHSQVYRIYLGMPLYNPNMIDKMSTKTPSFLGAPPPKREQMVRDFFRRRKTFVETCRDAMKPYQNIVRSICANTATVQLKNEKQRKFLRPLCIQAFCYGDASNGGSVAPFCDALLSDAEKDKSDGGGKQLADQPPFGAAARKVALLTLCVVLLVISLMVFSAQRSLLPGGSPGGSPP